MDERLHRRRGAGLSFLMGGEGEPLLLLHGVPGSAHTWQKVGIKIASRFRVIIPDLMGFGASDAPPDDEFFLEAQAKAVRRLLSYLQINRLYVGGHDFGASVAVTLLHRYPELDVRGLILAATNLFTDPQLPFPLTMARLPVFNNLFAWSMAGNRLAIRMLYESATYNKDEALWRDFRQHLTGGSLKLTRRILQQSFADFQGNYAAVEAALGEIACPSLVLWGDEDPFYTVQVAARVCAALPDAQLKVYAYTGHFVPEERPLESAEDIVLRFTGEPLVLQR